MTDVVIVDDAVSAAELSALRDGVLASKLLGDSPLGGTFLATRGFGITFHVDAKHDVVRRFPFTAPFFALALERVPAERVQRRPLLGGPPPPTAMYMNVLVVPPGAAVGKHVDATLGPPNGSVIPEGVAVLYLDVPDDIEGGRLVLTDGDVAVDSIEPRAGRFVLFAGRLFHEVTAVSSSTSRPRVSIVCEQYALSLGVLSTIPRMKVTSRSGFQAVLDDVRTRERAR